MKKLLIPVMASAAVFLAAPAHADTQGYLAWLQSHGVSDPAPNGNSLVSQGQQECQALQSGKSQSWLIGQLESQMGSAQAEDIVVAAHQYLCPGA
jgi:hypothetical protein